MDFIVTDNDSVSLTLNHIERRNFENWHFPHDLLPTTTGKHWFPWYLSTSSPFLLERSSPSTRLCVNTELCWREYVLQIHSASAFFLVLQVGFDIYSIVFACSLPNGQPDATDTWLYHYFQQSGKYFLLSLNIEITHHPRINCSLFSATENGHLSDLM